MNITARSVAVWTTAFLVLVLIAAAPATAQTKSLKDQLSGHWRLVSVSVNETTPYGAKPQGSMFLDAAGHYSVILITNGGARSIGYFGTYTVDEADHAMTMHIEASTHAGAAGTDLKRLLTFNGDELTVASAQPRGVLGGVKAIWRRAD
jgi:Lipocalin-like domain